MNTPEQRLELIKIAVKTKQSVSCDGMTLMPGVANKLFQFYQRLTPVNRQLFLNYDINRMGEIAESVVMALNIRGKTK